MRKNRSTGWILLSIFALFLSCNSATATPDQSQKGKTDEAPLLASVNDPRKPEALEAIETPKIPIDARFRVLEIQNLDLDSDQPEEQILVLQAKQNMGLPLTIQVADYDPLRKSHYLAWETQVLALANQAFSVSSDDIIGDHSTEIVVRGLDVSGHQTLDLYRRVSTTLTNGLEYKSILSLVSQGNISIEKAPRSQAYEMGQKNEFSYPIVVEENDPESNSLLDTIKTTYYWRFQTNQYVKAKVEKNHRETLADETLNALFLGETNDLENFIAGPWYKTTAEPGSEQEIIFFEPSERTITLFSEKAQEIYTWDLSSRTFRGGLYISGTNQLIDLIKIHCTLSITGLETIEFNASEAPNWTGSYRKMTPSIQKSLVSRPQKPLKVSQVPSGLYKNDKGLEISFDLPYFTMLENGRKISGAASIFALNGELVLQLKIIKDNGLHQELRAYKLQMSEEKTNLRALRSLVLVPGKLNVNGIAPDYLEPIHLEQIEVFSDELTP